jgi:hypothetical protein
VGSCADGARRGAERRVAVKWIFGGFLVDILLQPFHSGKLLRWRPDTLNDRRVEVVRECPPWWFEIGFRLGDCRRGADDVFGPSFKAIEQNLVYGVSLWLVFVGILCFVERLYHFLGFLRRRDGPNAATLDI